MKMYCILFLAAWCVCTTQSITVSPKQARVIGRKIWHNECRNTVEGLTSWKKGEEFASLGIGHFIWCPRNKSCPFSETFPSLVSFFKKHQVKLPAWLASAKGCPWNTRQEFTHYFYSTRMKELRTLLAATIDLQTIFIVQRLEQALPKMLNVAPSAKQPHIKQQFNYVAQSTNGLYALIDYVNFKGEGISTSERYNDQGWGLLHILERMNSKGAQTAVREFVRVAQELLTLRIHNAPAHRHEEQWLPGWKNRIKTYLA